MLEREPVRIRSLEGLPSLARANLLADALTRVVEQLPEREVAQWIIGLAVAHDEVAVEQIVTSINEERSVAGFRTIVDPQVVAIELQRRRQYYKQAIKEALDNLPTSSLVEVVTTAVDKVTDSGKRQAPLLIDDLVDSFEVEAQGFFEKETKNIAVLVQGLRSAAGCAEDYGHIDRLVTQLEIVIKNWDRVAQPIQVSAHSRGTSHNLSHEVAGGDKKPCG